MSIRFGVPLLPVFLAAFGALAPAAPGLAADPSDPDWPCVQRKVERLSAGAFWPDPLPQDASALPPDLEDLADRLALTRVTEAEAEALIAGLAETHPDLGADGFGRLFGAVFERIDRRRSDIVAGIARYARNQRRLSEEIEDLRAGMADLEAAPEPDFDRLDEVEAELDWRLRVFEDRNRALVYVCESPVLLEQRIFALARMMQATGD